MSNVHTEPKPSVCELTEKELDRVSGGGKKGATSGSTHSSGRPNEYLVFSLNEAFISS